MSEAALQQAVSASKENEFLSFVLGEEHYALDITTVKEIRGYEQVTKIANACNEQAKGSEDINESVSTIDAVTKTSNEAANESATTSRNLAQQAEALDKILRQFSTEHQSNSAS